MKAEDECFLCFTKQIANTHKLLETLRLPLPSSELFGLEEYFDKSVTPPQIAAQIYQNIREKSHVEDIYKELKKD